MINNIKKAMALTLSLAVIGGVTMSYGCGKNKDTSNIGFVVEAEIKEGNTIYTPTGNWGYRYGPAMMYSNDGILQGWFSGPPSTGIAWDDLFYKESADYGKTWSEEVAAVSPVLGSREEYSCCDPTAFRYNGYYYSLYTSTIESQGKYNDVYGCRSLNPTGPWEKWNGKEWKGSDPQPIVFYGSNADYYGIGEPSAVVVGDQIFLYYTYKGVLGNGAIVNQTRVMVGDITKENWPLTLVEKGVAVGAKADDEDSLDVKYIDDYKLFVGVTTRKRFSKQSYIQIYQSTDGITFYEAYKVDSSKAKLRLHNIGMTGDELGHIDLKKPQFVSYAYAENGLDWGFWSTEINQIEWKITQVKNLKEVLGTSVSIEGTFPDNTAPKIWGLSCSSETRAPEKAMDGKVNTFYSSNIHTGVDSSTTDYHSGKYFAEALAMTSEKGYAKGITLTPRDEGYCFPSKFDLQYSDDGIIWNTIASYSDYKLTDFKAINFEFKKTTAKYFRVYAIELTADQFGSYALQLAEMGLIY